MVKIYLDAGHGGKDGGAAANGIKEKDMVLDICKRIEKGLNDYEDVQVIQSRTSDTFLELSERTKKANNADADVLLSIHCNAATSTSAKGFESFIYPNAGSATVAFQNVLHQEIIRAMGAGITDRGKKSANFHMVRESKMKAVLTENLFVSNSSDAAKLKDYTFRQKIAQGHINGLEKFLGLKKKPEAPKEPTKNPDKLYYVQVGAFAEEDNAESMAADLRKLGYRPYIKYE
jgi:N-acetylmuramoyl-L-alanine amidase